MNSLNFTGNIGRDCETRFTQSGDPITSFSAALTSGYGEKKLTTWLNCSIFGKRGEALAPYLKKGAQVAITGEFAARPYTNKEGAEKLSLEVRVSDLTLVCGNKANESHANEAVQPKQQQSKPESKPAQSTGGGAFADFDDNIPFICEGAHGLWRVM